MGTNKRAQLSLVCFLNRSDISTFADDRNSSQNAEAVLNCPDRQTKQIRIIIMLRPTALTQTHCPNASKHLAAVVFLSGIWISLDAQSPARSFNLDLPAVSPAAIESPARHPQILAQNLTGNASSADVNKDLRLQDITITRTSSDKSLLTVTGSIENRSDRTHYVYYVVAKFIAKDVSIKQAIIPVNIDIAPGKSKPFTHEISADSINSIAPETVKPLVVKYEYR
jgi:hypothetical protein